jgi:hypothetical protein
VVDAFLLVLIALMNRINPNKAGLAIGPRLFPFANKGDQERQHFSRKLKGGPSDLLAVIAFGGPRSSCVRHDTLLPFGAQRAMASTMT